MLLDFVDTTLIHFEKSTFNKVKQSVEMMYLVSFPAVYTRDKNFAVVVYFELGRYNLDKDSFSCPNFLSNMYLVIHTCAYQHD